MDIAHGGTGANTAEQALASLGAASKAELDALSRKVTELLANGGTISGPLATKGGTTVWRANANSGKAGYIQIAEFKFTTHYANSPILLTAQSRGLRAEHAEMAFHNVDSADPGLSRFEYSGGSFLYLYKTETPGTWRLYAKKSEGYDEIDVTDFQFSEYAQNHIDWTWTDVFSESLPDGCVSPTPYKG